MNCRSTALLLCTLPALASCSSTGPSQPVGAPAVDRVHAAAEVGADTRERQRRAQETLLQALKQIRENRAVALRSLSRPVCGVHDPLQSSRSRPGSPTGRQHQPGGQGGADSAARCRITLNPPDRRTPFVPKAGDRLVVLANGSG